MTQIRVFVRLLTGFVLAWVLAFAPIAASAQTRPAPQEVIQGWYALILELVRHTPTYSPPVASRSFAYLGVTSYEALIGGDNTLVPLAGQVNGLTAAPARGTDAYDDAIVLDAALAFASAQFFANTGPTGQHALARMTEVMGAKVSDGVDPMIVERSIAHGKAIGQHILDWSATDGGAVIENLGFPYSYTLTEGPAHWVPTSKIALQQVPLLPKWGANRPFAMPNGAACPLPPPPAYSEDPSSAFYAEAMEVVTTTKSLTDEQKLIARFWSDDPMLSPTPPGHWISIAMEILAREDADAPRNAEVLAKLGMAVADGFIGCWNAKYEHDLLRPVTYIKRVIDKTWEPMLITPPFPEYPSGHSSQSGAAATVLSDLFGEDYAFDDATHQADGLPVRHFTGFWPAAQEAAQSRLYGGIHFRSAIDLGLEQGRCIGTHINNIRTRE
ncbi:MAG: vanadium-dependent haloperoxidase [Microgenomates group bacterium]